MINLQFSKKMSTAAGDQSLHDYLKRFLAQTEVEYTPVTAQLISKQPAQLTQDGFYYLESANLTSSLLVDSKAARTDPERSPVQVRLIEWEFLIRKPEQSSGQWLDIDVKKYELSATGSTKGYHKPSCVDILEINPFRKLYQEAVQRAKTGRQDEGTNDSVIAQGRIESKGEPGSNQGKYSFRSRQPGPTTFLSKESKTESQLAAKTSQDSGVDKQNKNVAGIRVSGINGKQNMKKLKEFRYPYITQSQDSLTNQVLNSEPLNLSVLSVLNGGKDEDSAAKTKASRGYLGKREPEDRAELDVPRFHPVLGESESKYVPIPDQEIYDSSYGIAAEQSQKKLRLSQKSEITFNRQAAKADVIGYDELLECLSVEKGLMGWKDIVFSKDVVKYLKSHMHDLMSKK